MADFVFAAQTYSPQANFSFGYSPSASFYSWGTPAGDYTPSANFDTEGTPPQATASLLDLSVRLLSGAETSAQVSRLGVGAVLTGNPDALAHVSRTAGEALHTVEEDFTEAQIPFLQAELLIPREYLNFPPNPARDDVYTYSDRAWQWNGHAWDVVRWHWLPYYLSWHSEAKPTAGVVYSHTLPVDLLLEPHDWGIGSCRTASTATATFTLSRILAPQDGIYGEAAPLAVVVFSAGQGVPVFLSASSHFFEKGSILLLTAPEQDATLAGISLSLYGRQLARAYATPGGE